MAGVDAGRPTNLYCQQPYWQGGIRSDLPVDPRGSGEHPKQAYHEIVLQVLHNECLGWHIRRPHVGSQYSNDDDDPFAGIHDDADLDLLYAD